MIISYSGYFRQGAGGNFYFSDPKGFISSSFILPILKGTRDDLHSYKGTLGDVKFKKIKFL